AGQRRIGPHTAGVRALVAVLSPLEVLHSRQSEGVRAVAECEDGDLLALEELLDHDRVPERAGCAERLVELRLVPADEDALSCSEAVRLDYARRPRDRQRLGGG